VKRFAKLYQFFLTAVISQHFFKRRAASTHVWKRKVILAGRTKRDGLRTAGCSSPMQRNDTTPQPASHRTRDSASTTRLTTYSTLDVRISTIHDHPFEHHCLLHFVTLSHISPVGFPHSPAIAQLNLRSVTLRLSLLGANYFRQCAAHFQTAFIISL
jgi:hypothetical protein